MVPGAVKFAANQHQTIQARNTRTRRWTRGAPSSSRVPPRSSWLPTTIGSSRTVAVDPGQAHLGKKEQGLDQARLNDLKHWPQPGPWV